MIERTSVTTDASGRRVSAKVAGNAEEAVRLAQEAGLLETGRHPGVVELVGVDGHGVGAVLLTGHVDGPTLAQIGLLPLEEGAGLLAALATTLADLHGLGLVHGAVCPEHVVVGPGGRPVLCSLGYGGGIGEAPAGGAPVLGRAFTDPCRESATVLDPAFDVFGLGALARFLAPDPPPGHVLATVADEATAEDPTDRPTARAVADALQREVPAARLPRGLVAPPPAPARSAARPPDPLDAWRRERSGAAHRRGGSRVRPAAVVAGVLVAGLVAGVVAAAVTVSGRRGGRPAPGLVAAPTVPVPDLPVPPPEEAASGPTTTRAVPASSTPTTTARANCTPAGGLLQADVDGDGCPEALRYADGLLQAADVIWSLGQPGDQVAVGDWGCQGTRSLALFRPSTGQVFRFDGWAGPGRDLTATVVAVVAGGQALRAADLDRDGCHEVVVERATGPAEIVRIPRAQG